MRILLNGIGGFMGREVVRAAENGYANATVVGGIDLCAEGAGDIPFASDFARAEELFPAGTADCLIDFSHHSCTEALLDFAVKTRTPLVLATTGHTEEELAAVARAAKHIPIFHSANMSLGVALLVKLAKEAARAMPDAEIEIVEKHHDRKIDSPSGTAMMLFREIKEVRPQATAVLGRGGQGKRTPDEIGIHAIRMGNIVGEHEVILCTNSQSITLKHEAYSRSLFADGALSAAVFLVKQTAGLYDMHDLLREN